MTFYPFLLIKFKFAFKKRIALKVLKSVLWKDSDYFLKGSANIFPEQSLKLIFTPSCLGKFRDMSSRLQEIRLIDVCGSPFRDMSVGSYLIYSPKCL